MLEYACCVVSLTFTCSHVSTDDERILDHVLLVRPEAHVDEVETAAARVAGELLLLGAAAVHPEERDLPGGLLAVDVDVVHRHVVDAGRQRLRLLRRHVHHLLHVGLEVLGVRLFARELHDDARAVALHRDGRRDRLHERALLERVLRVEEAAGAGLSAGEERHARRVGRAAPHAEQERLAVGFFPVELRVVDRLVVGGRIGLVLGIGGLRRRGRRHGGRDRGRRRVDRQRAAVRATAGREQHEPHHPHDRQTGALVHSSFPPTADAASTTAPT